MQHAGPGRLAGAGVTPREAEVLTAIGRRLTNREIASELVISARTVESHVSALLRKLDVADRAALTGLARQLPAVAPIAAPATSFVGRDGLVAELAGLLTPGALVSLVGPAGCGKTRLALETARRWPGAARLVELAPAAAHDVSTLVAAALGAGYEAADVAAAARIALAGTGLLLIIDNGEHVVAAVREVAGPLAGAVPGLRILVTSREPLGLDTERVFPVPLLGLPAGRGPQEVRVSPAGQLFLDRVQAACPGFRLDAASAPEVAAICARLDGLPLAIELATARVRTLGVTELRTDLDHRFELMDGPRRGRHGSIGAAIEWSWQLLDDGQRALLSRLAALPGEFTLALAAAVAPSGPDPGAGPVRLALDRLADQSLVSVLLPAGQPARYRLLEVIRAFARSRTPPQVSTESRAAHARFFADEAEAAVRVRYRPADPAPAAASPAGYDEPNILAALAWAGGHDPSLAGRLLVSVCQLADITPTRQALEMIRDVTQDGPAHPRTGQSEPGKSAARPGQWSSEPLARAAVTLAYLSLDDAEQRAAGSGRVAVSERDHALARWASGWVGAYRGREGPARRDLDDVIAYARSAGDAWLEASALQGRGVARAGDGGAFADWADAVTRYAVSGDLMHASNVRYMLASRAVATRTRLRDVPVWLDDCESYAASHGYAHEQAHVWLVRAGFRLLHGQPDAARDLLGAALPAFRRAGDFRCVSRALLDLARITRPADPAGAARLLIQSLHAAAVAPAPALPEQILAELAGTAASAGDLVLAARSLGALEALADGPAPQAPGQDTAPQAPGQDTAPEAPGQNPAPQAPATSVAPPRPDPGPSGAAALRRVRQEPAYAGYLAEGRAGGVGVLLALYPG